MTQKPLFSSEQKKELLAKVEELCWQYFVTTDQVDNILAVVDEEYEDLRRMDEWLDFQGIVTDGIGNTVESPGPNEN